MPVFDAHIHDFRLPADFRCLLPGFRNDLIAPVFRRAGRFGNDLVRCLLRGSHGGLVVQPALFRLVPGRLRLGIILVDRCAPGVQDLLHRLVQEPLDDQRQDQQIGQRGQDRPDVDGNNI